ncbi:MAG: hypothetical protein ACK4H7_01680 [Acidilobaceae archaeon]
MKGLAYILIALSIISMFTWIALYARDNSPMIARYSFSFKPNSTSVIYLWLIEGWANVSLFAPPCQSVYLIVYREGDRAVIHRGSFEGPRMELLQIHIPIPGHYAFQVASTRIEGCPAPDITGTYTVYQWGQPEHKLRTITLAASSIMLALGALILAYTTFRLR